MLSRGIQLYDRVCVMPSSSGSKIRSQLAISVVLDRSTPAQHLSFASFSRSKDSEEQAFHLSIGNHADSEDVHIFSLYRLKAFCFRGISCASLHSSAKTCSSMVTPIDGLAFRHVSGFVQSSSTLSGSLSASCQLVERI